jgi:Family of unknown function (DUF6982)
MSGLKVVVRFADGRIIKGSTSNFSPDKREFHVIPVYGDTTGESVKTSMRELKAIFFVKDFDGNPAYREPADQLGMMRSHGNLMEVEFRDGEVMVGTVQGHKANRQGFFLFPLDPANNNVKVFVVLSSVKEVVPLAASCLRA